MCLGIAEASCQARTITSDKRAEHLWPKHTKKPAYQSEYQMNQERWSRNEVHLTSAN